MKSRLKPLWIVVIVAIALLSAGLTQAVWSRPQSPSSPKAPSARSGNTILSVIYTPISLSTDNQSVPPDGSADPTLSSDYQERQASLRIVTRHPLRYKLLNLKKKPALAATAPTTKFYLQVYLVTFDTAGNRAKLKAVTNGEARRAWKYFDSSGTLQKWPDAGIPISVGSPGTMKNKVHYVGGTLGGNNNYLFVVYSDTPTIEDLFASTIIHIKD